MRPIQTPEPFLDQVKGQFSSLEQQRVEGIMAHLTGISFS
jgi:hypothetical protein